MLNFSNYLEKNFLSYIKKIYIYQQCNPYLAKPCCEKSDVCQRGITKMTFYCMEAGS